MANFGLKSKMKSFCFLWEIAWPMDYGTEYANEIAEFCAILYLFSKS
jgi:hypothetical protein